ncbi:sulfatase-like hydrolase/transferase [candidate division KSB1 bacterium]|nr:sulfatase-like hydrolase/transferase [candidate division KSB1 bacterium]
MRKKLFLLIMSLWLLGCDMTPQRNRPNIILFLSDDLGYNDLSCYRASHAVYSDRPPTSHTPNIDLLAQQGTRFTNFYCGAAVCSPSRASLLTGRNATRTGVYNWVPQNSPMHLRDEEVTIAEMLKQADYQTAHFGKWHLTSEGTDQPLPNDQGYDYSFFTFNNAVPSHHNPVNFMRNGDPVGELSGYSCQLVVDEAIQWLSSSRDAAKPFYINVWFNEPHVKLAAPPELTERHQYNQKYYGAIENMDRAVGRLLDFLQENDLDENTIIIFSSDNGSQVPGSNDPLRGEKALNFEGGIRVPFIIKWADKIPAGKVSEITGSFTDILPSIAGLTHTQLPQNRTLDGIDLSPVFMGAADSIERESPIFFFRYFHDPVCMLRENDWVLLGYDELIPYSENYDQVALAKLKPEPGAKPWSMWGFQPVHMNFLEKITPKYFELYNIKEDISQRNDVSSQHPDVVARMKQKMLELREEMIRDGGNWFSE